VVAGLVEVAEACELAVELAGAGPTKGLTIITSNKTIGERAETFGDEALAAAILDRLLHDAEVLAINGPGYRLKGRLDALKTPAPADHYAS